MIMPFDIVVEWVKMLGRVDLPFVNYIITSETLKHDYLIVPKMFLETVKFGYPPTTSLIDTCLL